MLQITLLLVSMVAIYGFQYSIQKNSFRTCQSVVMKLDNNAIQQLEELDSKYTRLSNVVSPESENEKAKIEEIVTKYKLYKEVDIMMKKIKTMWKTEVSDRRRDRQVKSFSELFRGKLEIEEVLKQKLGLPSSNTIPIIPEVSAVEKIDQEIAALKNKLENVKFVLPEGKSTREERFA